MPFLRYVIALALRAVVGIAGFALAAYGGVHIVGSIWLLAQMWEELSKAGDTPPGSFLLQHYGLYGGLTAVGIFLIVIAVRGIIVRIQAGLPTEDEGVGKTPLSRAINVLLYGAGFLFGAFSLVVSIGPGTQTAMLVAQGVTVRAEVLGYEATNDSQVWNMRYRFTTGTGEIITDVMPTEPVPERPSEHLLSDGVDVTYVANDPSNHAVTHFYSHSSFVFFVITRALIAAVGVWGLIRNLSPSPHPSVRASVPSAATQPTYASRFSPSDPPARMAETTRAVPGVRRKTFGRR